MRIYAQNKKVLGYEDGDDAEMSWIRFERQRNGSIYIDKCGEVTLTRKQRAKVAAFIGLGCDVANPDNNTLERAEQ